MLCNNRKISCNVCRYDYMISHVSYDVNNLYYGQSKQWFTNNVFSNEKFRAFDILLSKWWCLKMISKFIKRCHWTLISFLWHMSFDFFVNHCFSKIKQLKKSLYIKCFSIVNKSLKIYLINCCFDSLNQNFLLT